MKKLIFILLALPFCLMADKYAILNTNEWDRMEELRNTPMFMPCAIIRFPDGTVLTNYQQVISVDGKYIPINNYSLPTYTLNLLSCSLSITKRRSAFHYSTIGES